MAPTNIRITFPPLKKYSPNESITDVQPCTALGIVKIADCFKKV